MLCITIHHLFLYLWSCILYAIMCRKRNLAQPRTPCRPPWFQSWIKPLLNLVHATHRPALRGCGGPLLHHQLLPAASGLQARPCAGWTGCLAAARSAGSRSCEVSGKEMSEIMRSLTGPCHTRGWLTPTCSSCTSPDLGRRLLTPSAITSQRSLAQ